MNAREQIEHFLKTGDFIPNENVLIIPNRKLIGVEPLFIGEHEIKVFVDPFSPPNHFYLMNTKDFERVFDHNQMRLELYDKMKGGN